jgi:MraZ protein
MGAFWSSYTNKVDRKGRLSVPASFRPLLMSADFEGVVAFPAFRSAAIECRSWEQMNELAKAVDALPEFSSEREAMAAAIFGSSTPLGFDSEGRIILPKALAAHAGITSEATFVGMGTSFQIWEPKNFAAFRQIAREDIVRQRLTLPKPPGGQT